MPSNGGHWWSILPANQPLRIVGSAPEQIRDELDPPPADAPPVVFLWPSAVRPFSEQVLWLLDEMDRVALRLLHHWLPGAATLTDASPMSLAAVDTLAKHLADQSSHYRTFIADLARRALMAQFGRGMPSKHSFAPEVRAAELVRVLEAAYGRKHLAVLVSRV